MYGLHINYTIETASFSHIYVTIFTTQARLSVTAAVRGRQPHITKI